MLNRIVRWLVSGNERTSDTILCRVTLKIFSNSAKAFDFFVRVCYNDLAIE